MKEHFLLNPEITFLNHGPFGACPRQVFEFYQTLQMEVELNPIQFMGRDFVSRMRFAREYLARYVHCHADEIVWMNNVTSAVNTVAHALDLPQGSEVLMSNHEYGACMFAFKCWGAERGYTIREQSVDFPVTTIEAIVEQFFSGVTERTKLIFLSHISSDTALIFPIEAVCKRARELGILTFIDGAHALGQLDVDLHGYGCDFYTANAHKWLMAPRGAAMLYARRAVQSHIKPLVVSWGYKGHSDFDSGFKYIDYLEWRGTDDPCPFLSVPRAIDFQNQHDWHSHRLRCNALVERWLTETETLLGVNSNYPGNNGFYHQMATVEVPVRFDVQLLCQKLFEDHRIEINASHWRDRQYLRVSVQAYNDERDLDKFHSALKQLLC